MAGRIPESFINDLLGRVDIVDVVGSRVQLKKSGRNHKGLCPFHTEKTPSFNVNEDRQTFHCFGCEAHGTAIGFLMEYDNMTFPEAVEELASTVGVEVPREAGGGPKADPALYDVLEAAATRFRAWLREPAAQTAVDYLKRRGLSDAIARDFGLGVAPAGWDRLRTALASYGEQKLIDAGLLIRQDGGRVYDRFRERVMFPIRNTRGRVVGFGGRVYGDGEPKYINSPETDLFHKARELYGLYEVRRARRRLGSIVVVEGYMDVVALAQHGVTHAVATLGTAIGRPHFEMLYRHVDVVTCCFDGDEAGRGAAWKAVDAAFPVLSGTRQLKFVFLPEGEDPDTVVRSRGREHFQRLLDDATPVGEYFLDHVQAGHDLRQADGRAALAELARRDIDKLPPGPLREVLIEELASRTHMNTASLGLAASYPPSEGSGSRDPDRGPPYRTLSKPGELLVRSLVRYPDLFRELNAQDCERLLDADSSLLADVVRYLMDEPETDTGTLVGRFVGDAAYETLASFATLPMALSLDEIRADFPTRLRRHVAELRLSSLRRDSHERASVEDLRRQADAKRQHML